MIDQVGKMIAGLVELEGAIFWVVGVEIEGVLNLGDGLGLIDGAAIFVGAAENGIEGLGNSEGDGAF